MKNKWHQKKNSEIKKGGASRALLEGDHRKLVAQSHVWHTGSGCVGEEDLENLIYKIDDLAKLYHYYFFCDVGAIKSRRHVRVTLLCLQ